MSSFFSLIGIFDKIMTTISDRRFKKIDLPDEYDLEKILSYFKLRPEKILIRFFQITIETIKFFSILPIDYFIRFETKQFYSNQYDAQAKQKPAAFDIIKIEIIIQNLLTKNLIRDNFKILRSKKFLKFIKVQTDTKQELFFRFRENNKARQLRDVVTKLSPAFIKLAQAFASRPDLVGEKIAKELQRLQDGMPFFPNDKAFEFIKEELGASSSKIFSEISKSPVAAASLGQVYKAVLDNVPVAIKVQRPGLNELLALDIILIRFLALFVQKLLNFRTDLVAVVDEYAYRLFEELDYRKEASNMIKFKSLYGYMEMIYIPKVFLDYSSRRVLVMEWIEGERLVRNSSKILQEDISLIEVGVRCLLVQLLEIGFLHCDPHGGNLIKTKQGQLAYIDFGLVSEIPESVRYSLIKAILHFINREYDLLARDFSGLALLRNDDLDKEILNFSKALSEAFDRYHSDSDNFTFQDVTEKIFRLTVRFPFILPPYFLNNLRAIATLEGIALMADSKFKIVDVIYPYIISRLLTNRAPQFSIALEDFLINNRTMKPNWGKLQALLQNPEWSETFPNQSENISDGILNFIISPAGSFLLKLMLRDLIDIIERKVMFCFYHGNAEKYLENKYEMIKKRYDFHVEFRNLSSRSGDVFSLILFESRIYNLKIFISILKISVFSSAIIFLELFIRFYSFLLKRLTFGFRKIFFFLKKSQM